MNLMQPFVQKNAKGYESLRADDPSVFEYYSFWEEPKARPINAVPDGCVDLLYGIGEHDVRCYLGGTVLKMKYWPFDQNRMYFGIRFQPGKCILPKDIRIEDIINTDIEIPSDAYGINIDEQLYTAKDIHARAAVVSHLLQTTGRQPVRHKNGHFYERDAKEGIESYIRRRIYETKGSISIREISAETGYSECYVRRSFHEMHGISPKTFEKIVRFQNTLNEMAKQKNPAFYDLAVVSGYYDQSHMVKEFKSFMGLTPENYFKYMANA